MLNLPDLTLKEIQGRVDDLDASRFTDFSHINSLLKWLWDIVSRPYLEVLGLKDPVSDNIWPRV